MRQSRCLPKNLITRFAPCLLTVLGQLATSLGLPAFEGGAHGGGGHHSAAQANSGWQFTPTNGSIYANQPFTISGTVGFQNNPTSFGLQSGSNPITSLPMYNPRFSSTAGSGFGVIPGLAVVAPGWSGYPYYPYGNYGYGYGYNRYGYGYPIWGNGYNMTGLPFGIWGLNSNQNWNNWNGPGFVWNNGVNRAMNEIVQRGNARVGPIRPVKKAAARKGKPIVVPPAAENPGGLNAIAPRPNIGMRNGPMDPLSVVISEPKTDSEVGLASAVMNETQPLAMKAGLPDAEPQEVRNPKGLQSLPENATKAQKQEWLSGRLQTADRLARNGLIDEARVRYENLAKTLEDQAAPWLRIAQIEVLSGHPDQALAAWQQAMDRESGLMASLMDKFQWTDIADNFAIAEAQKSLKDWSSQNGLKGLGTLETTIGLTKQREVAVKP